MRGVKPFILDAAKKKRLVIVKVTICADHCDDPGACNMEMTSLFTWEKALEYSDLHTAMSAREEANAEWVEK